MERKEGLVLAACACATFSVYLKNTGQLCSYRFTVEVPGEPRAQLYARHTCTLHTVVQGRENCCA